MEKSVAWGREKTGAWVTRAESETIITWLYKKNRRGDRWNILKKHKMGDANQINEMFLYWRLMEIRRLKAEIKKLEIEREKDTRDLIICLAPPLMAAICVIFYTYFIK